MAASVFTNGSLETGNFVPFAGFDFSRVESPSAAIDGWTVTSGNVDWVGSYWQAADGARSVDLDGAEHVNGAISQTFDTSVNSTYVVTFGISGNPDLGLGTKSLTVDAGAAATPFSYEVTAANSRADMLWSTRTYTFVATSTSTTLTFTSTTPEPAKGYGAVIDNVVVTQTLHTGADCKNGGWKTMTDKVGMAFRNQGDCVSYYATGEKNLAF
jgi:choice-of-anchor C domain-containing protein